MYDFQSKALRRVSPIYDRSEFIKHFFKAIGGSFEIIRPYFESLREQSFIDLVTYGIDWQETKYSLPHRYDLTLEERRALLGIKARKHLPLNPKVLENHILENCGLKTFLSEATPGFIDIFYNSLTEEQWLFATEFLLRERPAHLMIQASWKKHIYHGEGEEPEHNPEDEPKVPTDFDDRKNFPRIFFGNAEILSGVISLDIAKPKNDLKKIYAGCAQIFEGIAEISLSKPKNLLKRLFAGVAVSIGGEITIGCQFPPKPDIRETPVADILIADWGIAR